MKKGSSCKFMGSPELHSLYLDTIHRIDWIHFFLCFRTKQRNRHPAFSRKKAKNSIV